MKTEDDFYSLIEYEPRDHCKTVDDAIFSYLALLQCSDWPTTPIIVFRYIVNKYEPGWYNPLVGMIEHAEMSRNGSIAASVKLVKAAHKFSEVFHKEARVRCVERVESINVDIVNWVEGNRGRFTDSRQRQIDKWLKKDHWRYEEPL